MWDRIRKWKHAAIPMLMAVASVLLTQAREGSTVWFVGLGLVGIMGVAYLIEEVAWNIHEGGRPCAACGQPVRMRSFRVRNTCPGCGQQL